MEFETILEQIDGYGFYQKRMRLMVSITNHAVFSQVMSFMMFAAAAPRWTCESDYTENITYVANTPYCDLNSTCIQTFEEDIVTLATEFGLYCKDFWVGDVLTSIQMVGVFCGALFWGQMSEIFGRRKSYFCALLLASSSGLIGAFSPTWHFFAATLYFTGFGLGGYCILTFLTIQEIICPTRRPGVEVLNGWPIGLCVFGGLMWLLRHWRYISIVVHGCGLLSLISFIWIYESPRWLVQHGKWEAAHAVLAKIAETNARTAPSLGQIKQLKTVSTDEYHKNHNYSHLFRTKKYTAYTLALMFSWFTVSFVSYALLFNAKSLPTNRYLTVELMGILMLVANIGFFALSKCVGRKTTHQISLISIFVVLVSLVIIQKWGSSLGALQKALVTILALVGKNMTTGGWLVCYLYSAELFPTVIRNLSNGLSSTMARVGSIMGPLLLLTVHTMPALPYLVFSGVCIINALVAWFILPETKDQPLPEGLPDKNNSAETERVKPLIVNEAA